MSFFFFRALAIITMQLHWWFLCGNSPVHGIDRYRDLRGNSDRTGPRRGPCRHVAAKGEAAAVHPGCAHGPTDSSGHRTSSRPLSVDICFRDSVVFTSSTCWHTMPRSTQSFPLSHPNHGELVFDSPVSRCRGMNGTPAQGETDGNPFRPVQHLSDYRMGGANRPIAAL